jgi:dipeptidyl aminopeptidase/acylaminoacyl peptidase
MSLEHHVNEKTPPAFIWHTVADIAVPVENSLLFAQGLRGKNIPFELHIYPEGPHGLALGTEESMKEDNKLYPSVATWTSLCMEWLKKSLRF